jgi:hypothetical protein
MHLPAQLGRDGVIELAVQREIGNDSGDNGGHGRGDLHILRQVNHHAKNPQNHCGGDNRVHAGNIACFSRWGKDNRPALFLGGILRPFLFFGDF